MTHDRFLFLDPFIFLSVTLQGLKSLKLENCHWVTVDNIYIYIKALTSHQNNLQGVDFT
jgi:hypothetical protein